MPKSTADIKLDENTSFLLVGDSGTKKTSFFATLPKPVYVVDTDNGMSVLRGIQGIEFDTFKEVPKGEILKKGGQLTSEGWYEYGYAWPAILAKINEIGRSLDQGTCQYKAIGVDSLTMLTDCALTYLLRMNGGEFKDGRQMWQPFLNNMSQLFGQLTSWNLIKVLTAHIKRDENLITGQTEKLPLVPGQFSGKVSVYFDEVYFTDITTTGVGDKKVAKYFIHTIPDAIMRQAKSRKLFLPTATLPPDYAAIMEFVANRKDILPIARGGLTLGK